MSIFKADSVRGPHLRSRQLRVCVALAVAGGGGPLCGPRRRADGGLGLRGQPVRACRCRQRLVHARVARLSRAPPAGVRLRRRQRGNPSSVYEPNVARSGARRSPDGGHVGGRCGCGGASARPERPVVPPSRNRRIVNGHGVRAAGDGASATFARVDVGCSGGRWSLTGAVGAQLFVPTGSASSFSGDGGWRLWPRFMLAGAPYGSPGLPASATTCGPARTGAWRRGKRSRRRWRPAGA